MKQASKGNQKKGGVRTRRSLPSRGGMTSRMRSAPVALSSLRVQPGARAAFELRNSEYITDVTSSSIEGQFLSTQIGINPGQAAAFPWASAIASNFEEYETLQLEFEYRPLVPTNTQGLIMLAFQYDYYDGNFNSKVGMQDYAGAVSTSVWEPVRLVVDCKQLAARQRSLYVLPQGASAATDNLQYFAGNIVYGTSNMAAASVVCGELFVRYNFRLKKPLIPGSLGGSFSADPPAYKGEAATPTFGTTPVSNSVGLNWSNVSQKFSDDPALTFGAADDVGESTNTSIQTTGYQGTAKDFDYWVEYLQNALPTTTPTVSAGANYFATNGATFTPDVSSSYFTTTGTAGGSSPSMFTAIRGLLNLGGVIPSTFATPGNSLLHFHSPVFTGGTGLSDSAQGILRFVKLAKQSGLVSQRRAKYQKQGFLLVAPSKELLSSQRVRAAGRSEGDEKSRSEDFELIADPRSSTRAPDIRCQDDLALFARLKASTKEQAATPAPSVRLSAR